jgi:hypothetical protein
MHLFDCEKRPFHEGASLRNTVSTYTIQCVKIEYLLGEPTGTFYVYGSARMFRLSQSSLYQSNWTSKLLAIKQCTVCGKGTAYKYPFHIECSVCGAIGDPILGLMEPREAFERG